MQRATCRLSEPFFLHHRRHTKKADFRLKVSLDTLCEGYVSEDTDKNKKSLKTYL